MPLFFSQILSILFSVYQPIDQSASAYAASLGAVGVSNSREAASGSDWSAQPARPASADALSSSSSSLLVPVLSKKSTQTSPASRKAVQLAGAKAKYVRQSSPPQQDESAQSGVASASGSDSKIIRRAEVPAQLTSTLDHIVSQVYSFRSS